MMIEVIPFGLKKKNIYIYMFVDFFLLKFKETNNILNIFQRKIFSIMCLYHFNVLSL